MFLHIVIQFYNDKSRHYEYVTNANYHRLPRFAETVSSWSANSKAFNIKWQKIISAKSLQLRYTQKRQRRRLVVDAEMDHLIFFRLQQN